MTMWVFLRGLTRECRHWGDFPAVFRRELPDADIHVPDLPGNGRLNALRSPASIGAMAEHCRNALREQGSRPPYFLLAMSLGAMVAAEWAARHPKELRGCVLIGTSFGGISPFHRRLRPRALPRQARGPQSRAPGQPQSSRRREPADPGDGLI